MAKVWPKYGKKYASPIQKSYITVGGFLWMETIMKHTLAALALVLGTASVAQAATITNGSFETGTAPGAVGYRTINAVNSTAIDGWTVTSGSIDYISTYWTASDGRRSIDMSGGNVGTISTTITDLIVGYTYELLFDLSGNPAGAPPVKTVSVSVGSTGGVFTYDTSAGTPPTSLTDMNWITQSLVFVATGSTALLTFASGTGTAYGPALDNVRVSAVPLPAGGLLLLSGLAGFAALRRRKTA